MKEPIDRENSAPIDWPAIVGRYGSLVWRTAYRLLGNRADAEDCYQETFTSALKVSGREKVQNWPGLLQRLATVRGLEILRVRQRRKRERGEDFPPEALSPNFPPHRRAEGSEIMAALLAAVAELPVAQGQIFCMRFLNEMSYEEIARVMGISDDAVGMSLNRAKAAVRLRLQPMYSELGRLKMNLEPLPSPSDDEWLDSIAQTLRETPIPDGPEPALNARVIRNLAAMQNMSAHHVSVRSAGRRLLAGRIGKLAAVAAILMLLLANPFFRPGNFHSGSAAYGDELHTEQLQVGLLRMLYDLEATPEQLRELQAMSSNTLAENVDRPADAKAQAAPNFAGALTALHKAFLDGNEDLIDAAEAKVDDLAEQYSIQEVDVEPTAAARSKAESALALFNANQIAGYLSEYSDDVEDPAQSLVDAVGDCRGLGPAAFAEMRQTVASKIGLLVAGLDSARASAISRQVVELLDKAHAGKAPEFAKVRADLENNARQIAGNVNAFEVLHHFMVGRMAALLSNPHLHAMLTIRLQNEK